MPQPHQSAGSVSVPTIKYLSVENPDPLVLAVGANILAESGVFFVAHRGNSAPNGCCSTIDPTSGRGAGRPLQCDRVQGLAAGPWARGVAADRDRTRQIAGGQWDVLCSAIVWSALGCGASSPITAVRGSECPPRTNCAEGTNISTALTPPDCFQNTAVPRQT